MTIVTVLSIKGAPGVTMLASLLAATSSTAGRVVLIESDPSGGDLGPRFGLSGALGQHSLQSAVRRSGSQTSLDPHLQRLPGGLPVLVGTGTDHGTDGSAWRDVVVGAVADGLGVVDLGRWHPDGPSTGDWLERSDGTIVVLGAEAPAALHLRTRAARMLDATGGRLGVVVVGGRDHDGAGVTAFTGIRSLGDLPFDPQAARVACGTSGAMRRLDRSPLLAAVRRVGAEVAALIAASDGGAWDGPGDTAPASVPAHAPARRRSSIGRWRRPSGPAGDLGRGVDESDGRGRPSTDTRASSAAAIPGTSLR